MTVQELERTAARVHDDPRAPAEVVLRVNGREHRLRSTRAPRCSTRCASTSA